MSLGFRRDVQAAWEIVGIALLVALPVVLFLMLVKYLRASTPGGVIETPVNPKKPDMPEKQVSGPATKVAGARICNRCNVAVKPHKGGGGKECPNCGSLLT